MTMSNNTRRALSRFVEIATNAVRSFDEDRRKETNEKILIGLKKMGLATQDEVTALKEQIDGLESELRATRQERSETSV